ncbi:hypothetical protein GLYMA_15G150500v4 [Glycine max]|uniref:Uncharacterized protein n=1 Tax=Glycine max TaxID=3847 RepID=K7MBF7_SOYBN|nr:hypothetical protein GYH30_042428 [Glycine max]KRH12081.1 hypothetical protein GLYMA_15G150500v4 [Glycine max]
MAQENNDPPRDENFRNENFRDENFRDESRQSLSFRSPMSRMLSFTRMLGRERKGNVSLSSCGSDCSCAAEQGEPEETQ